MPTFSFWILLGFHLPFVFSERRKLQNSCSSVLMNSCEVKDSTTSCDFSWGGSSVYKCDGNGSWRPENSVQTCGSVVDTAGLLATSDCQSSAEGDTCQVSCRPGYSGSATYLCQSGIWTFLDAPLKCSPIHCPPLTYLPYVESECSDTIYGSTCTTTCDAGYVGVSKEYVCDESGSWQPVESAIQCSAINCGAYIEGVNATCTGATQYGQAACQFECELSERSQLYVCMQTGEWFPIGDPLDCRYCPPFASLFGEFAKTDCEVTSVGSVCSASCNEEFDGDEQQYRCSESGEWKPINQPLICSASCGSIIGPSTSTSSICTIDGTYIHESSNLPSCETNETVSTPIPSPDCPETESNTQLQDCPTSFETWQVALFCATAFLLGLCSGSCLHSDKSSKSNPPKVAEMTSVGGGVLGDNFEKPAPPKPPVRHVKRQSRNIDFNYDGGVISRNTYANQNPYPNPYHNRANSRREVDVWSPRSRSQPMPNRRAPNRPERRRPSANFPQIKRAPSSRF